MCSMSLTAPMVQKLALLAMNPKTAARAKPYAAT